MPEPVPVIGPDRRETTGSSTGRTREREACLALPVAFVTLGGYTLLLQIVLVRESFLLFAGNELTVALQLGLWLGLTAAGGWLGSLLPARAFPVLLTALPVTGLAAVAGARLLPLALPVGQGEEVPVLLAIATLAVAQAPVNLTAGALFPTGCAELGRGAADIGRCFMLECLGGAVAGVLHTLLLAGHMAGADAAAGASSLVAILAVVLVWRRAVRWRAPALAVALGLGAVALLCEPARLLDLRWWRAWHPGSDHVATFETPYQRLDVGLRHAQRTLYSNGRPLAVVGDHSELLGARTWADLFLSLHPGPESVLVIGALEPSLVERVLEHPLRVVTWVVHDTAVVEACALSDPRLDLRHDDPRRFLHSGQGRFDVVILDQGPPTTAAANRLFTVEAFAAARTHLTPGGRLVLRLPSSAHYLAGDSELLVASVSRALEQVFGAVALLAGDDMVLVAGGGEQAPAVDMVASRLAARGVALRFPGGNAITDPVDVERVFRALIEPLFDPVRCSEQRQGLDRTEIAANCDRRPLAYSMALRRWLREVGLGGLLDDGIARWHEALWAVSLVSGVVVSLTLIVGCLGSDRGRAVRASMVAAVAVSGWAGMAGELALVLTYQSLHGQLYRTMGALFALYMTGAVTGSWLAQRRWLAPQARCLPTLVGARALMIASCLACLALPPDASATTIFVALYAYAAALGLEYPLANRCYADSGGRRGAGVLHGADHAGAAVASLLAATLLLPQVGPAGILRLVVWTHVLVLAPLAAAAIGRAPAASASSSSTRSSSG